jgi:hypothetical protein
MEQELMGFHTEQSKQAEIDAAKRLNKHWRGVVHSYGDYNAIDWWIEKGGQIYGVAEFKNRNLKSTTYKTVFISLRKWTMLQLAATSGVKAFYVVNFKDKLMYCDIHEVPVSKLQIIGRKRSRAKNDTEPVFELPISKMKEVK